MKIKLKIGKKLNFENLPTHILCLRVAQYTVVSGFNTVFGYN